MAPQVVVDAAEELLLETIPGGIESSAQSQSVRNPPQTAEVDGRISALLPNSSLSQYMNNQVNSKRVLQ